jgi:hypothetical protein
MPKRFYIPFLYIITTLIGVGYGSKWIGLYDPGNENDVILLTNFSGDKPSVFRVIVPLLARILIDSLAIPPDYSIFVVIVISFTAMFWALQYFGLTFSEKYEDVALYALGGVLISSILLSAGFGKIYDPATVFFFALSLGFIARGQLKEYYFLFPFATLNRETTFLLVIVFSLYYCHRISFVKYVCGIIYQALVYILIKLCLSHLFAGNGGKPMYFLEYKVFQVYMSNPLLTAGVIFIFVVCMYYVFRNWMEKPLFLRVAFLSIFPVQILLHILLGYAYELRVFIESVPVICMLYMFNAKESQPPS